jgi:proteic killer suppression protein
VIKDRRVTRFLSGEFVGPFSGFSKQLERRLNYLLTVRSLDDIRGIPGHHLEMLKGDRAGQYSIRINAQYRICFEWSEVAHRAVEIEVADYH